MLHLIIHCDKNYLYIFKHYVSPLTVHYWDIVFRLVFKITATLRKVNIYSEIETMHKLI